MLAVLANRTFRHLFAAQIASLLGTGLLTVALGLLAYDLAGGDAALILGIIFTIKMIAYVGIAPIAAAFADRVPRRTMLVALDLVRAITVLLLPFVTEVWQTFALVFILQSASAAFTPTFQATIPDVLPDEGEYTRALSLSRLAYDIESVTSPALAALILLAFSFDALFVFAVIGFLGSAFLILTTSLPDPQPSEPRSIRDRTTRGIRIYLATPRLRGLLAMNFAVSATGAMILVNTIVLVRADLGLTDTHVALALGAFGAGSMTMAFTLPRLLDTMTDRPVMTSAALTLPVIFIVFALLIASIGLRWPLLLATWFAIGLAWSAVLTPAGRLLRRSANAADRPAVFAAQFALSHACWLITYPLAGWLQTEFGTLTTLTILATLAATGAGLALRVWPGEAGTPQQQ